MDLGIAQIWVSHGLLVFQSHWVRICCVATVVPAYGSSSVQGRDWRSENVLCAYRQDSDCYSTVPQTLWHDVGDQGNETVRNSHEMYRYRKGNIDGNFFPSFEGAFCVYSMHRHLAWHANSCLEMPSFARDRESGARIWSCLFPCGPNPLRDNSEAAD